MSITTYAATFLTPMALATRIMPGRLRPEEMEIGPKKVFQQKLKIKKVLDPSRHGTM